MSKLYILLSVIILFLLIFSSERVNNISNNNFFSDICNSLNIEFIKHGDLYLINNNSVIVKKIEIEIAKEYTDKINGLKFRSSMEEDRGIIFLLKNQEEYKKINTQGIRKFLDIIYIDEYNTIIYINKNVNPINEIDINLLPSTIKYILEINAGMVEKWKIKEGFKINLVLTNKK
ncbi:DUF192 domain-containing protein [Blattabacterium cuenoti]|uniref:DUF192 domain-containing protein n=1 Tax=Blattabacterium cuenoti TaxID=1653831 RepID=UPI00163BEE77|nr:DUF192 domain-containing protein [Blattabacterium cuenoti]